MHKPLPATSDEAGKRWHFSTHMFSTQADGCEIK